MMLSQAPSPMDRFLSLYGSSGRPALEAYILDFYRRSVVRDGAIDPHSHEAFLRYYDAPLSKLPDLRQKIKERRAE